MFIMCNYYALGCAKAKVQVKCFRQTEQCVYYAYMKFLDEFHNLEETRNRENYFKGN
jgi:hypothetical protein